MRVRGVRVAARVSRVMVVDRVTRLRVRGVSGVSVRVARVSAMNVSRVKVRASVRVRAMVKVRVRVVRVRSRGVKVSGVGVFAARVDGVTVSGMRQRNIMSFLPCVTCLHARMYASHSWSV